MSGNKIDPKFIKSHYDPAVHHLLSTIDLAKETGASEKVIESLQEVLKLCKQRDQFTSDITSAESDLCAKIYKDTMSHDWQKEYNEKKTLWNCLADMISGQVEGQFLKSILSGQRAKRVLEVGMFTGYSALSMAEALPADGKVVSLEIDGFFKTMVESFIKDSPHKNKIEIIIGPAIDTMTKMRDDGEKFDAIFLDAAKSEYPDYLKLAIEGNLLAHGGTVIVDNAFMRGSGYTKPDSPTAKFAEILKSYQDLHKVLVPIRDGMYLIRRRVDVEGGVA